MSHQLTRFPHQLRVLFLPIMVLVMASIVFAMLTIAPVAQADVTSMTASAITSTTATLTISSDNNNGGDWIAYRYKPTSGGSTAWVGDTLAYGASLTVNLTGLTASTAYEVQAFNHNTGNTDRFLPGGDGWTTWPAQIRHASFTTASSNNITSVTARSVGPAIAQIIANLTGISSVTTINFRYRVATPPGAWTTATENAAINDTTAIHKITSGLVVGTEYDIEASVSSTFVTSVSTTHTHLGTTLIIFDTRDNELYEFSDLSDLTTHTDHGDLANVGTVRTMEEHEGWLYLVNATNHDLYRSRTPRTVSSWTNKLGTWSGLGGGSQSVISANGNLYEITSTSIGRVVNPSDPSAGFTDIAILGFSPTGAVYYDGVLYLISGTHIRVIPDIDNPTVGVTTTLTGMTHGRGMTVFNDRVLMNEEDDRQIFELQNLDTTPTALLLGTYTSDLYYGSSIAVWLDLPAPIVSSVSIDSILDTSVTANITATDATSAGVDFRFRYRIGDTGPWTDATSVNSSTTTAAISVTGLTATQAYNYQASLDSVYPADDRTEGTFTTIAATTPLGKVSGVVLTTPIDNGLRVTWSPVTNATSYRVQWATSAGGQSSSNEAVVNSGVTYDITGLTTNDEYFVQVRAETTTTGYSSGPYSDEVSKLTKIPAPENVVTSTTTTTITVSWDAVAGATTYEVWYSIGSAPSTVLTVTAPTVTRTITSLTTNTTYRIWIKAKIGSVSSAFSTLVEATPMAPTTPQAPTGLSLVAGLELITASWTAPTNTGTSSITGYQLEHKVKGAGTWTVLSLSSTGTSSTITGLTAGAEYEVRVAAKSTVGTGPYSDIEEATAEGAPDTPILGVRISIEAPASNLGNANLYWDVPHDNSGGITSYDVRYRVTGSSSGWTTVNRTTTAYPISGLTLHQIYDMQVRANNSHGSSDYSEIQTFQYSPRKLFFLNQGVAVLYRLDTNAAVSVSVITGPLGGSSVSDIADMAIINGRMYVVRSGVNTLYEINLGTYASSAVCDFTATGQAHGIAELNDEAYINVGGSIYTIDVSSCAVTLVGDTMDRNIRELTSANGKLLALISSTGSIWIREIDTSDGSVSTLKSQRLAGQYHGLASNGDRVFTVALTSTGNLYYISLTSLNNARQVGQRGLGNADLDEIHAMAVLTMSPPGVPTSVTTAPTSDSITVTWDAPVKIGAGPIQGYKVQYKASTSSTWIDWPHTGTTTEATITGLATTTAYNIRVAATNVAGAGEYSTAVDRATGGTAPGVPVSLSLTPADDSLVVTWGLPTNTGGHPVDGYKVQYKASTSSTWLDWTHSSASRTATITGLNNGTSYDVRVAAVNTLGTGPYTATETAAPNVKLVAPTNIRTTPSVDTIDVDWDDVLYATGYVIQWSLTSGDYAASIGTTNQAIIVILLSAVAPVSSYQITGLTENTPYFIRIMATAS